MTKLTGQGKALAAHYAGELSGWAPITTRPLFGAVALYRDGLVFAMVWQGSLYFKVDNASRADYEAAGSHALGYVSEGNDHALKSYWEVPVDVLEDNEILTIWAQQAWSAALKTAKG
ncbi:TfoX/Sxy family protein [Dickeya chrysanthemi]|uniref:TfoX/Sxy family protein n=1 Tax=Dickeya chrysanthemi TaxID=556 RepID=A0ABU8JQ76_DICCH|nr:TfoX/Sxy family protein [Dickeya chrysanthemi]MBX9447022.1 TfoX/Sxy family protein [Dickeya chrysanthemi]MCA7005725.1 TfoX/Sxy family protein [Dickeya chrysanthemi]